MVETTVLICQKTKISASSQLSAVCAQCKGQSIDPKPWPIAAEPHFGKSSRKTAKKFTASRKTTRKMQAVKLPHNSRLATNNSFSP